MPIRWVMLAAFALGGTACADCPNYESRGADMRAQISPPGAVIEQVVSVSVSEIRSPRFRSVGFGVTGANLRWHVLGVRLIEATGEGRVLFGITSGIPGPDANEAGGGSITDTDPAFGTWESFLLLLDRGGVVVELTTDVPGLESVRLPFSAGNAAVWYTAPCENDW